MSKGTGRSNIPVFGVLLTGAGLLLLLQTLGVVDWWVWADIWRLWPLVLVTLGLTLIFGRLHRWAGTAIALAAVAIAIGLAITTSGGEVVTDSFDVPLAGVSSSTVKIDFGGGELRVSSLPAGSASLMSATITDRAGGVEHSFTTDGGRGSLEIKAGGGIARAVRRREWEIRLAQGVRLEFEVNAGAGDLHLDLERLDVSEVDLSFGASSLDLVLPASAGHVAARVSGGASSIEITVPKGVAARIKNDSGLSSVEVDESRFPKSGDFHISPGFDTAADRIDLEISTGVSSINVK